MKRKTRSGFQINLSKAEKDLIASAANKQGLALAAFIRAAAIKTAQLALLDSTTTEVR